MFAHDPKVFGRQWSARLCADPLALRVMAAIAREAPNQADPVLDRARADSPLVDAVIVADLEKTREHVLEHFHAMLALPGDRVETLGDDPMAFVRAHGRRRARAGVPLNTVLQGYRTGHKSFWAVICRTIDRLAPDAAAALPTTMLLSDYCIEYTDLISSVLTEAYFAEETLLAAQRTRLSVTVLDDLLRGAIPATSEAAEFCTLCGISDGRHMVVAVVRSPTDVYQRSEVAQRLESVLAANQFGRLIEPRANNIVVIASAAGEAGCRLASALRDSNRKWHPMRIGIGLEVLRVRDIVRSYAEACTALDLGDSDVVHLADIRVGDYLRRCADGTALRLLPPWTAELLDGDLAETLRTYADADMNIKLCAARLDVHGNTIYHRLARVQRITGLDPRTYSGLTHMLDALAIARLSRHET